MKRKRGRERGRVGGREGEREGQKERGGKERKGKEANLHQIKKGRKELGIIEYLGRARSDSGGI